MRRVTQRLLERNGFRVVTAKDGVEAISVLQDHRPTHPPGRGEPRMDGTICPARPERRGLAKVPISWSRPASVRSTRPAIEIGVNDYRQPYQERELLEAVQHQWSPARS